MEKEQFSDWTALEVTAEPAGKPGGSIALALSVISAALAVLTYAYAEAEWLSRTPTNGGIGMGTSAYSTVQFERPIVFAALAAAFAALSIAQRRPMLGGRIFWRSVYETATAPKPPAGP